MKVVILAGGVGTRISEESSVRPKPLIEIGHHPILWHIMRIYGSYGLTEFVICCGYKGHLLKEYFANYYLRNSDVTFDLAKNNIFYHKTYAEPWSVTLIDTGDDTLTGGRLKRIRDYIGGETFCMTYGDGVANIDVKELINFHRSEGRFATLTAVQPPGRFGAFMLSEGENRLQHFREKPVGDGAWINGGFFVLEPQVLDYIKDDKTVWEQEPMEKLTIEGQMSAYRHTGFWQNMDTLRDKMYLEKLWDSGNPPWIVAAQ
jgi:glucose-1-phosphate cytidylyltransferase